MEFFSTPICTLAGTPPDTANSRELACIITRMITKLVLRHQSVEARQWGHESTRIWGLRPAMVLEFELTMGSDRMEVTSECGRKSMRPEEGQRYAAVFEGWRPEVVFAGRRRWSRFAIFCPVAKFCFADLDRAARLFRGGVGEQVAEDTS